MAVSSFPYGIFGAASESASPVLLDGDTLQDDSVTPTDAEVGYQLSGAGLEQSYVGIGNPYITIGSGWLLSGSAGDYDCKCTVNSGTTPAGSATGSWLVLSSARAWTLTDTGPIGPPKVCNLTIEIAATGTTSPILASATVSMAVQETA